MRNASSLFFLSLFACGGAAGSAEPAGPTGPAEPTGPRTVHQGDTVEGTLHLGEEHVFLIEMGDLESVSATVTGESGPSTETSGCGNWGWSWHNEAGEWTNGNPLALAPNQDGSGVREDGPIGLAAPAGAGTWAFHLQADPGNCQEIAYSIHFE